MKKFILGTLTFALAVIIIFTLAFAFIPSGRMGDVYERITSPLQSSIVIGTSRAAQAVNPEIINSRLKTAYFTPLYNFAFHLDASSYNEVYETAIYKKLAPCINRRNIFVIAVDPWAVRKLDSIPRELALHSYSQSPNMEYIAKNFSRSWFSPLPTHSFVNKYGRTEVDYVPKTKEEWEKRVDMRLAAYIDMAKKYCYDQNSQYVLERIIDTLKKRGDIFLVRIPVSKAMRNLENKICPDFDDRMFTISKKHAIAYFDFKKADYKTTDGNHMTQSEGNRFSKELADSIAKKVNINPAFSQTSKNHF